jgi:RNA polymerase sigma factor (sigma-70 family)
MARPGRRKTPPQTSERKSPLIDSDAWQVMFPDTQWTMVEQAQRGDADSIDKLVRQYATPMFCFLRRSGWPHEHAKDIVQDVFCKLADKGLPSSLKSRDPDYPFRAYLRAALRNRAISEKRKTRSKKRLPEAWQVSLDRAIEEAGSLLEPAIRETPDDVAVRRETRDKLNRIIKAVQQQCRKKLSRHFSIFADRHLGGWAPLESGPFKDSHSLPDARPGRPHDSDHWGPIARKHGVSVERARTMCATVEHRVGQALRAEFGEDETFRLASIFARAACSR